MRIVFALVPLLVLAACGAWPTPQKADHTLAEDDTVISINAKDDGGEAVQIKADGKSGQVSVKVQDFEGSLKLPKGMIDTSNMDIDGVSLYPGSKVKSINVNSDGSAEQGKAKVNMAFTAPDTPAKVAAYFRAAFADRDVTLGGDDARLSGKTSDGNPFTISLAPGAAGETAGTVLIDAEENR